MQIWIRKNAFAVLVALCFMTSFVISAYVLHQRSDVAQANVKQQQNTRQIGLRDFGIWSYRATEQGSTVVLDVSLLRQDNLGLEQYAKANDALATKLFQDRVAVEGRVVFKKPLLESSLPAFLQANLSKIKSYELRIGGGQNERFTVFGAPDASTFLPPNQIEYFTKSVAERTGHADFKGITSVKLDVTSDAYRALTNSPDVLLVDVVPTAALEDFKQSFKDDATGRAIDVGYIPVYWYYETSLLTN